MANIVLKAIQHSYGTSRNGQNRDMNPGSLIHRAPNFSKVQYTKYTHMGIRVFTIVQPKVISFC